MAEISVTVKDKTFPIDVPDNIIKNRDHEYVEKAARDHYNRHYATESGTPEFPTVKPPVTQDPEFQRMESTGGQGFLESGWNALKQLPGAMLQGIMPSTQQKAYSDPNDPSTESFSEMRKHLPSPINEGGDDTSFKAMHGNIGGAIGDIAPGALLALGTSPRIRGAVGGGLKAIPTVMQDISSGATPLERNLGRAGGVGLGYGMAHWPGAIAGGALGGELGPAVLHPGELAHGIGKGAIAGMGDRSLVPQIIGDVPPSPVNFAGRNYPGVNPAPRPNEYPQIPGRVLVTPPPEVPNAPKQLGPATQIQMPGGFPAPEDDLEMFRRGASQAPVQPPNYRNPATIYGKELQASGPRVLSPQEVEQLRIKSSSEQTPPKELDQQVPANVESANKDLPSSKALDIANPKSSLGPKALEASKKIKVRKPSEVIEKGISDPEERLSKAFEGKGKKELSPKQLKEPEKNTITSLDSSKKPHFTHKILGDIAKSISDDKNKISMTEVGRWVHEHDYGTYEPSKFGEGNFGAGRNTKTEPSKSKKQLSTLNDTLIEEGIKKYIKDNPKKF